jgi:hypothetical protein
MSQFDFPRLNFHGKAYLDTPTANNGYIPYITIFDQNESEVFMPPRIYFQGGAAPPPGLPVETDKNGVQYVPITPVTVDNFQQWATTPLGSFAADAAYAAYYGLLENFRNESWLLELLW